MVAIVPKHSIERYLYAKNASMVRRTAEKMIQFKIYISNDIISNYHNKDKQIIG